MATMEHIKASWEFAREMDPNPENPKYEIVTIAEIRKVDGGYVRFFVLTPIGHPGFQEIIPCAGGRFVIRKEGRR